MLLQHLPEPHPARRLQNRLLYLVQRERFIRCLLIQNYAQLQMPTQQSVECERSPCKPETNSLQSNELTNAVNPKTCRPTLNFPQFKKVGFAGYLRHCRGR